MELFWPDNHSVGYTNRAIGEMLMHLGRFSEASEKFKKIAKRMRWKKVAEDVKKFVSDKAQANLPQATKKVHDLVTQLDQMLSQVTTVSEALRDLSKSAREDVKSSLKVFLDKTYFEYLSKL